MNRKQLLKNIQKEKKNNKDIEQKDTYFKFITTLAILLIVFILAYFLIGLFYTKEIDLKKDKEKEKTSEINVDNNTIMLGQLFDQPKDEYYVLVYDASDETSLIPSWKSIYESKENNLTIYTVDSSKKFNSKYIVKKDGNKNATGLNDLRVVSPTIMKISNKTIVEYIEGEDEIVNLLKQN